MQVFTTAGARRSPLQAEFSRYAATLCLPKSQVCSSDTGPRKRLRANSSKTSTTKPIANQSPQGLFVCTPMADPQRCFQMFQRGSCLPTPNLFELHFTCWLPFGLRIFGHRSGEKTLKARRAECQRTAENPPGFSGPAVFQRAEHVGPPQKGR